MTGNAENGNIGCGAIFLALIALGLVISVLKAVWGLLGLLAVAAFIAAFRVHKKETDETAEAKRKDDSYYTQKCPNCGAQIKVSEYRRNAQCEYCGSTFAAEREPIQKPAVDEKVGLIATLSKPLNALMVTGVVLLVLSMFGFAFSGS